MDELIGKYLAGEASPQENAILRSWIEQSQANKKYFDHFKLIFQKSATFKVHQHFDVDMAWNKVREKLYQNPGRIVCFPEKTSLNILWRIAAGIVIILSAGFFGYKIFRSSGLKPIEVNVVTEKKSGADTLPDGSHVFLNRETKLAYTFDKRKKVHKVQLQGEAYFNVHHNDDNKFIVEIGNVLIRDIGTSFNVKGYPGSNTVEVVVEEGEVMFYTENDSGIYLRAGGKGIYHKQTKTFTVEEAEPNVTAYKTRFFIFSDTDLATAVNSLNAVYDKKLIVAKNLKTCRFTGSFNNKSIDEIANVIAETLGFTVKHSGDMIVLKGKGCEK